MAPIPTRTTKIRRYYWREIAFREMQLFSDWAERHGLSFEAATSTAAEAARKECREQALREIKQLHETKAKYSFEEESQDNIVHRYQVEVIDFKATYVDVASAKTARVLEADVPVGVEDYVRHNFEQQGFQSLFVESAPFHVLFGVFMWVLIQNQDDPHVRLVGFGDRNAFEGHLPQREIWTWLPDDFGTSGYGKRRATQIDEHLSFLMQNRDGVEWLFGYWLTHSEDFRQYLWAHREKDINTARELLHIVPSETIHDILRYLVEDYWRRYCGWPDLLMYRGREFFFAEVKSSGDRLSEDQKNWIRGNHAVLHLPFKLVKVHRS